MRPATLVLVAVLAVLVAGEHADAAMSRKACRASCETAIAACVNRGGRRAVCRRQTIQRCRRQGPTACEIFQASTPTTTYPFPTTTIPSAELGIGLTVHDVRTAFEVDLYTPAADAQFLLVDVTIDNGSGYNFTPYGFQFQTAGLGFPQNFLADGNYPGCSTNVMILPGGSFTCTMAFEIPEGTPAGRLAFGVPYGYGYGYGPTTSAILTEEFQIPVVVRPSATLDVLATGTGDAYCSGRPGFKALQVTFAYTSHDGASRLDLGAYQFVLEADGALYTPIYCGYVADPCDASIGVPVNGSASCSLIFQVPASVTEAELRAVTTRYPASVTFGLD
jgi:hypothetical protein